MGYLGYELGQLWGKPCFFRLEGYTVGQQVNRLRPAMRKHPGRVASRAAKPLPARMIISVIFCPCPIWPGAFLFLEFLEAVEVNSMG